MFISSVKQFNGSSFLILLIFCSPIIFAQNKVWQQVSFSEQQSETVKTESQIDDENFNSVNFENPSPVNYSRLNFKISGQSISEPEITESRKFSFRTNFFIVPNTKSTVIFIRRPRLSVDIRAKTSLLNVESYPFNQDARIFENDTYNNFAASQRLRKYSLFNDDKVNFDDSNSTINEGFRWRSAITQSLMFLAIQHGYAFTQLKTREALKGSFFKDYAKSVKSLHGWADGGRFFTNYIAHPMQGAFTGFIQIQNDPKGLRERFGTSKDYWQSRLKALAWTAAWSTQFEIGLISQASIGNVGLKGKQTYVDLVMTPLGGTAMLISEDAIDRFVMENIERRTKNFYIIAFSRMLLSPTRTIANLFRFRMPWYRDRPRAQ